MDSTAAPTIAADDARYIASWSPNGQFLAYVGQSNWEVVRPDGKGLPVVIDDASTSAMIAWSSDSSSLAWIDNDRNLNISKADGSGAEQIDVMANTSVYVTWRP